MKDSTYGSLVEVFRGTLWEAELIKGLLESAGVEAMIKDETLSAVTSPYSNIGGRVLVMVNKEEEVYAKKVVSERKVCKLFAALAISSFFISGMNAQGLQSTTWQSYGISFKAPQGFQTEEDSEEGYIISTPTYYITAQLLEGEGFKKSELEKELKLIATDDEIGNQTPVRSFELPQFYGVSLSGNCEQEQCLYSYLMTKDGASGFYISIVYSDKKDLLPEKMLKSFTLEE